MPNLSIASNQLVNGAWALKDPSNGLTKTCTFFAKSVSSSNSSVFTANINAAGEVQVIAVAAGSGNLTVTANCTYTDPFTSQQITKTKSTVYNVTITQAQVDNFVIEIAWSAPQEQA